MTYNEKGHRICPDIQAIVDATGGKRNNASSMLLRWRKQGKDIEIEIPAFVARCKERAAKKEAKRLRKSRTVPLDDIDPIALAAAIATTVENHIRKPRTTLYHRLDTGEWVTYSPSGKRIDLK